MRCRSTRDEWLASGLALAVRAWQRVMGRPLTRELEDPPADPARRLEAWRALAATTRRRAQNPPHKLAWLCIHRFEGAWHDPNAPYYGGLQMDVQFQRTYAPVLFRLKGTADHWTPLEQIWGNATTTNQLWATRK